MSPESEPSQGADGRAAFFRRHRRELLVASLWLDLLGCYGLYAWRSELTPPEIAQRSISFMSAGALLGSTPGCSSPRRLSS